MLDLVKFHVNPYDDIKISLNNLIDYTGTHLQRLVENNPGALFNQRITATTTALSGLDATMSDNDTKLSLRMARVHAKEAFRQALPENLLRIHSAVIAAFGPDSTQENECFPQGRKPFAVCPDDQLDDKLEALLNCLTPWSAQVGITHVSNLGACSRPGSRCSQRWNPPRRKRTLRNRPGAARGRPCNSSCSKTFWPWPLPSRTILPGPEHIIPSICWRIPSRPNRKAKLLRNIIPKEDR